MYQNTLIKIHIEEAAKIANVSLSGVKTMNIAGKGFKMVKLSKLAKPLAVASAVLTISEGVIKVFNGFANKDGKLIAKGVFGTAAAIGGGVGGGMIGTQIGTLICPGVGTVIGGAVGATVYSLWTQWLVEDVIIENI